MNAKKLGIKSGQLPRLELAIPGGNLWVHEMPPFPLIVGDHVLSRHKLHKKLAR